MGKKSMEEKSNNNYQMNKAEEKEITKTIQKSRINMLMQYPFFGILSLKLELVVDYSIPTIETNGTQLIYNPNFIKKYTIKQINFLIAHEILHCALRHLSRAKTRNIKKWNYACDCAVNSILINDCSNSIFDTPKNALYKDEFKNMAAEEIYSSLPDNYSTNNTNFDSHPWDKTVQSEIESCEKDWQTSLINAAKSAQSKNAGSIPGFVERYINKLTNPQKDWRILLTEFIEPDSSDYNFTRPDYRIDYDEFGCFLPSIYDEEEKAVKQILFWIDTSGSINDNELNRIFSEVAGAVQQFNSFEGYLGFFDSKAYPPTEFNDITSLMEIKPIGGGGTDFNVPFNFVNDNDEFNNIKCIIMLTDGYCNFPSNQITDIPVIWLITTEGITAPWGTSIYLPLK